MAVSDNTGYRDRTDSWLHRLNQLSRYDLVLAAIPTVFVAAVAAHLILAVSLHLAVGTAALVGAALVADVLYLHPPARAGSPDEQKTGHREGASQSPRGGD
jgi:hypothetical protein